MDGYEFPIYSTESCPRNQSEWNKRSSAINCTDNNGYMCIPNDDRTQLLEFCYIYPRILITKGKKSLSLCLDLYKSWPKSNVNYVPCISRTLSCIKWCINIFVIKIMFQIKCLWIIKKLLMFVTWYIRYIATSWNYVFL